MQQSSGGTVGAPAPDLGTPTRKVLHRMRKAAGSRKTGKKKKKNEDEAESGTQNTGSQQQSVKLFQRPPARAVSPYVPQSEAADVKLRELIFHYTTIVAVHTVTPVGPRREVSENKHYHSVITDG